MLTLTSHNSSLHECRMLDCVARGQRAGRGREGRVKILQCARALPFEKPPKMYRPPVLGLFLGEGTNVAV